MLRSEGLSKETQKYLVLIPVWFLAAFFFAFGEMKSIYEHWDSRQWQYTSAIVTHAEERLDFSGVSGSRKGYCPIRYVYVVSGKKYTGDSISFTPSYAFDRNVAVECFVFTSVKPYPKKGEQITVKYNPRRPEQAVYIADFPNHSARSLFWFVAISFVIFMALRTEAMRPKQ